MPTVLIVASSPLDQGRLRLGTEVKEIRNALKRSKNRESWIIESNEAATVDDLRLALLDFHPTVVHFAGHGSGQHGLCFEDANGSTHSANAEPLAKLFHHFKEDLKCVVLNACYSDAQGEVIRQEIDYVIGMGDAVDDDSACKFAVAFYDAIFAGTDFRTGFDLACTSLDLNSLPDSEVPVFMTSPHLDGTSLSYKAIVPEIERVLYAYLNTPYSDRWSFTTSGEVLLTKMRQHYGEQLHRAFGKVQVEAMSPLNPECWRVAVSVQGDEIEFYLRIRDRVVQIEWEATVGLWSMPLKTYLALGPREPIVARVIAELDDYYNFDFMDQELYYQSVALYSKSSKSLHGYVQRGSAVYNDLMLILSDGNRHSVTLEIAHATSKTDMPLINKLLSATWLYSPDIITT